jgi:hypothetical protein
MDSTYKDNSEVCRRLKLLQGFQMYDIICKRYPQTLKRKKETNKQRD